MLNYCQTLTGSTATVTQSRKNRRFKCNARKLAEVANINIICYSRIDFRTLKNAWITRKYVELYQKCTRTKLHFMCPLIC